MMMRADGCVQRSWFADVDGDGFGDDGETTTACVAPEDHTEVGGDCDDDDADVHPDATEVCDEVDNDCNGEIDEGVSLTFYADADGDGFGDDSGAMTACEPVVGLIEEGGDCDDSDGDVSPDAWEVCNGVDDNCDGAIDEGVTTTFYRDADSDGFGDPLAAVEACEAPEDHTAEPGDCDDSCDTCHPDGSEVCDGLDNDCDTDVDEDAGDRYWPDCDGDTYAVWARASIRSCEVPAPVDGCAAWTEREPSYITTSDCDDENEEVRPGADYHDTPRPGTVDNWDWDCSGSFQPIEKLYTNTNYTRCTGDCSGGWTGSRVPECGQSASFQGCLQSIVPGQCGQLLVGQVTQRCK